MADVADSEDGDDDGDGCGDEDEGDQAEVSGGDGEAGAADGDEEAEACIVCGARCRVSGWHGRRGGRAVGVFCHGDDGGWVLGAGCFNKNARAEVNRAGRLRFGMRIRRWRLRKRLRRFCRCVR